MDPEDSIQGCQTVKGPNNVNSIIREGILLGEVENFLQRTIPLSWTYMVTNINGII